MEIYQIRAFVTVARLGNLTKAAEALSLTQPAVTAQLKALEQSLGVALFDRAAGRLSLAKAGEALLPTAEALLVLGAQLKSEARQLQGQLQGVIDLGVPSEQPDFLRLGELAAALRQHLPLVELKTHVLPSTALLEQVGTARLAGALTIVAHPPRGVTWHALRSVRYRIALPASLADTLKRAGWRDIAQLPWLDGPSGSHLHLLLRDMFERHGLAPRVVMQNDDQSNLDALVRAGAGCALLREETALAGAAAGDFIVWGQARADATLGFIAPPEQAGEPMLVALISIIQNLEARRRHGPHEYKRMTEIWFIRHGETDWNRQRRLQGWQDIPLNESGREQARLLAERLRDTASEHPFAALYSSDLKRAHDTAASLSAALQLRVRTEPGIRERGFGVLEGLEMENLEQQAPRMRRPGAAAIRCVRWKAARRWGSSRRASSPPSTTWRPATPANASWPSRTAARSTSSGAMPAACPGCPALRRAAQRQHQPRRDRAAQMGSPGLGRCRAHRRRNRQ